LLGKQVQLLNHVLVQQNSLETSQQEISLWLDAGQQFLNTLSLKGGKESIQQSLEQHKVNFIRLPSK
jgi:guanylate kinase